MTSHLKHTKNSRHQQTGVALVVVLIFMLALSIVAIFSSRNATLGERQARNELEYQVARQAAEAALRDAENDLLNAITGTPTCTRTDSAFRRDGRWSVAAESEFTDTCLRGQCNFYLPDRTTPPARYEVTWAQAAINTTVDPGAENLPGPPWWPTNRNGLWGNKVSVSTANCTTFTGGVPLGTFTGAAAFPGVARPPEYMIEMIRPDKISTLEPDFECPITAAVGANANSLASADETGGGANTTSTGAPCQIFRITARGFGASTQAALLGNNPNPLVEVVLQSYFAYESVPLN